MFNHFSLLILERLQGKKLATILGERTGTSERTWRKRFKDGGWSPCPKELKDFRGKAAARIAAQMKAVDGWSEEEVQEIISRNPSWKAGIGLPTAELIYWFSPKYGEDYAESIEIAGQFDLLCHDLSDANKARNLDGFRKALLNALHWLTSAFPTEEGNSDIEKLIQQFECSTDLAELQDKAKLLGEQLILHVMSCWDIEFCANYFSNKIEAFPLFELMMPRLSPDIEVERGTGRFLRRGSPPKRGVFEKSMSRFLDFLAVLIHWHKYRLPPQSLPAIKDLAAWCNEDERRIISWRDETTNFTVHQLFDLWSTAIGPDKNGIYPSSPTPMFVAAHLLSPLLTRVDGKPTQWLDCFDTYEVCWKRNLSRLTAKGLKFGSIPWPKCLIDQPGGNRSLESWRSSQSSGRSSQPLDSQ